MKHKILLISHCFFNDGAKLKKQDISAYEKERNDKRVFIKQALEAGIEFIQLPCPEFILYGSDRWGHAASQFDHPFFRQEVKRMLEPIVLQLKEYMAHPEKFEILGVLGIDGSPSCGVRYTYDGDWGGEFTGNVSLEQTLSTLHKADRPGIMMNVLGEMLCAEGMQMEFYSMENFPPQFLDQRYEKA